MNLKVLYVIDGLGPGGAERSLADMLPHLGSAGIQPIIAFFDRRHEGLEAGLRARGADLRYLPQRGLWRRIRALRRLIRAERPDVIHTTLFESDILGRFASIGHEAVVVTSLVNTSYDPIRLRDAHVSAFKLNLVRVIDGWTARHLTTHFHAITRAVKQSAVDTLGLPPERITVIERGRREPVAPHADGRRAETRRTLGLDDADEIILCVGRQDYQKGHRYLLEAMTEVMRCRTHAVLLVAGRKGNQSSALEELAAQRAFGSRVRLLGHREDVPDLLRAADLFVFPSLYEGLGGSLLEAMSFGLPIVASRLPAIEEVVEEGRNALLVERASPAALATAIVELLTDHERAGAFGKRSREIFETRFTLDRSTARMVEFYRRVARRDDPRMAIQPAPGVPCE